MEAAHFEIVDSPAVCIEALVEVCELLENSQVNEQNNTGRKQVILNGKTHKQKEDKANEPASALDNGKRKKCSVREERWRGNNDNHGLSNSRRGSGEKGGKR